VNDFEGKVAVVTGAAEGIGRAIAERAAAAGMKLVLADINSAKLEAFAGELRANGVEAIARTVDVAGARQVDALAGAAFERFGRVHLLVNNAGVGLAKPVWETTERDWEWVMGVNVYGVTHSLRAFVPRMIAGGEEGHIVNVASIAGLLSEPGLAAYNASKFAVVTISEGLHHDLQLRRSLLKVSVLCPGWVKTRIADAERHRDPAERSDFTKLDEKAQRTAMAIVDSVQNGIAPAEVAAAVFRAIEAGEFYILTHEATRAGVTVRMNDIVQNRPPTLLPF
jgi:NAD(P)-dependent dehydrogenase (short-subunit alcohol dehydrogenase family)